MFRTRRLAHRLLLLALALGLAGCAGQRAFREATALVAEGKGDAATAKFEEALRQEPTNGQYRIALLNHRALLLSRALSAADTARREGRLSDAEAAFQRVLAMDGDNAVARRGLAELGAERRHRALIAEADALLRKGGADDLTSALEKLRTVLSENPRQREAGTLRARIVEVQAKQRQPERKLGAAFRKPITLEFRDTPIKAVFEFISRASGLNFFYDRDIRPDIRVTILAKDTSIEDAVALLLRTHQLEQRVLREDAVLVYPSTPQKLKEYQALSVRTFFVANADVKSVSNTLKTIVKLKDMAIDERLGVIVVRDTPEAIRLAERLVAMLDMGDPEVMLEVEVLEVKRSRLMELGIQWPAQLSLAPLQAAGSSLTLQDLSNLNSSRIQATVGPVQLNLRKEDQDANILANPRIRVRNKDKAKILIGDRVPVITSTSTATGFLSESISFVDVGLKLEVEPNISLEDEVSIKVNLEVSTLVREITTGNGSLAYQIGTRGATTTLRLADGETQVLAGLIKDEDRSTANKVPGVGELPVVGRLLGSQKDDSQTNEILLSITPRIVRGLRRPDLVEAEFDSGTDAFLGAPPLQLDAVEPAAKDAPRSGGAAPAAARPVPAVPEPAGPVGVAPASPAVSAPAAPPAAGLAAPRFSWQAPQQVKVGEQFSAVLRLNSTSRIRGLPLLVSTDPTLVQVTNVQEGDHFRQGGRRTTFSHRLDPAQGRVFATVVRQGVGVQDEGVSGEGTVLTVTMRAVKAGSARVQLLSATPEPPGPGAPALPAETVVRVVP